MIGNRGERTGGTLQNATLPRQISKSQRDPLYLLRAISKTDADEVRENPALYFSAILWAEKDALRRLSKATEF